MKMTIEDMTANEPSANPGNHTHRHSRTHSGHSAHRRHHQRNILEPVWYFTGTVLFMLLARLLDIQVAPSVLGAAGILALALSKPWKFRTGVILSVALVLTSVMLFNWRFLDIWFLAAVAGEFATKPGMYSQALTGMFVPLLLLGIYTRQIDGIHIRSSQKWFVKKSYLKFLTLLLFFQLFLFLFLVFDLALLRSTGLFRITPPDAAVVAGAIAMLAAGIPAVVYIVRGAWNKSGRHRHRHRHRHTHGETPGKNPSTAEK